MNTINGHKLCMSGSQAIKEARRKRTGVIYIWETVCLPELFYEICRRKRIAVIFTR